MSLVISQLIYFYHFSFLLVNSISLYECTTVCLSIHLLKDILVASRFWQL